MSDYRISRQQAVHRRTLQRRVRRASLAATLILCTVTTTSAAGPLAADGPPSGSPPAAEVQLELMPPLPLQIGRLAPTPQRGLQLNPHHAQPTSDRRAGSEDLIRPAGGAALEASSSQASADGAPVLLRPAANLLTLRPISTPHTSSGQAAPPGTAASQPETSQPGASRIVPAAKIVAATPSRSAAGNAFVTPAAPPRISGEGGASVVRAAPDGEAAISFSISDDGVHTKASLGEPTGKRDVASDGSTARLAVAPRIARPSIVAAPVAPLQLDAEPAPKPQPAAVAKAAPQPVLDTPVPAEPPLDAAQPRVSKLPVVQNPRAVVIAVPRSADEARPGSRRSVAAAEIPQRQSRTGGQRSLNPERRPNTERAVVRRSAPMNPVASTNPVAPAGPAAPLTSVSSALPANAASAANSAPAANAASPANSASAANAASPANSTSPVSPASPVSSLSSASPVSPISPEGSASPHVPASPTTSAAPVSRTPRPTDVARSTPERKAEGSATPRRPRPSASIPTPPAESEALAARSAATDRQPVIIAATAPLQNVQQPKPAAAAEPTPAPKLMTTSQALVIEVPVSDKSRSNVSAASAKALPPQASVATLPSSSDSAGKPTESRPTTGSHGFAIPATAVMALSSGSSKTSDTEHSVATPSSPATANSPSTPSPAEASTADAVSAGSAAASPVAAGAKARSDAESIVLQTAETQTITPRHAIRRVRLEDREVCEAVLVGPYKLLLIGRRDGTTRLAVWSDNDSEPSLYDVQVVSAQLTPAGASLAAVAGRLTETISAAYPNSQVRVVTQGDGLAVNGRVASQESAREIMRLVRRACLTSVDDNLEIR